MLFVGCHGNEPKGTPVELSQIVFLTNRDSEKRYFDIFSMNLDGSNQTNLTNGKYAVRTLSTPVLSPDHTKMAFISFEHDKNSVMIYDFVTKEFHNVADHDTDISELLFSPDGEKVLFVKRTGPNRQIYSVDLDGMHEKNISSSQFDEFDPSYSPDGSKIAFVSKKRDMEAICVMDADGKNKNILSYENGKFRHPSFSADGRKIVYTMSQKGNSNIYLMNIDGSNVSQLTYQNTHDVHPCVSPDSRFVIFLSNPRGKRYQDICSLNISTRQIKVLTDNLNFINKNPKLTPDGKTIYFESVQFNNSEIYALNLSDGSLTNLTRHPSWDQSPDI